VKGGREGFSYVPELPEVETIMHELAPHIVGRTITSVELFWDRTVRQPSADEFRKRLAGQRITGVSRRGKYLLIKLEGTDTLVIHLKLTGSLWQRLPPEGMRFVRAMIGLDDGCSIYFRDPRKFGKMWLVPDAAVATGVLGPEPLEPDFTAGVLATRLKRHKIPVKAAILDQGIIAGVGNMYADEALFSARIHPTRPADNLTVAEVKRLHRAILQVLLAGIGNKGASVENYYRPDGSKGSAHTEFKVAHQRGGSCPRCGSPIEYMKVRGRGTYYCPKCQRK
jgi:formamidopyrimidine-DNA glycosylase